MRLSGRSVDTIYIHGFGMQKHVQAWCCVKRVVLCTLLMVFLNNGLFTLCFDFSLEIMIQTPHDNKSSDLVWFTQLIFFFQRRNRPKWIVQIIIWVNNVFCEPLIIFFLHFFYQLAEWTFFFHFYWWHHAIGDWIYIRIKQINQINYAPMARKLRIEKNKIRSNIVETGPRIPLTSTQIYEPNLFTWEAS